MVRYNKRLFYLAKLIKCSMNLWLKIRRIKKYRYILVWYPIGWYIHRCYKEMFSLSADEFRKMLKKNG